MDPEDTGIDESELESGEESQESTPDWHRLPRETAKAYVAFRAYSDMAPGIRSVQAAYNLMYPEKVGKQPRSWQDWSRMWEWPARARAEDQNRADEARAIAKLALTAEIVELEREKLDLRRKQVRLGNALVERAERMLAHPFLTQVSADGQTIIAPAGWKQGDIPKLAEVGVELVRLATDDVEDDLTRGISDHYGMGAGSDALPQAEADLTNELIDRIDAIILRVTAPAAGDRGRADRDTAEGEAETRETPGPE